MERSENEIAAYHILTRAVVVLQAGITLAELERIRVRLALENHRDPDEDTIEAALAAVDVVLREARKYEASKKAYPAAPSVDSASRGKTRA